MTGNTSPGSGAALAVDASEEPVLRVEDLHHSYGTGAAAVHALRGGGPSPSGAVNRSPARAARAPARRRCCT